MADVNLPLSGPVTQSFAFAPWLTNAITINLGNSSAPDTEKAMLDVASYGKQLGRIGDALIVLLKHLPANAKLSEHDEHAIRDLKSMLNEIANVKEQHGAKYVLRPE